MNAHSACDLSAGAAPRAAAAAHRLREALAVWLVTRPGQAWRQEVCRGNAGLLTGGERQSPDDSDFLARLVPLTAVATYLGPRDGKLSAGQPAAAGVGRPGMSPAEQLLKWLADAAGRCPPIAAASHALQRAVDEFREAPPASRPPGEAPTWDPAARFLELFLASFAPPERRAGGVFYTPQPIAEYLVQRTLALVAEYDLVAPSSWLRGVDPACGTGVFLLTLARHVAAERAAGRAAFPVGLAGCDLQPAACLMAGELLQRAAPSAVDGPQPWYAEIHCASLLELPTLSARLLGLDDGPASFPVILGNPPYANFGRRNRGPWIVEQLGAYKTALPERKLNLHDDCIKFIRWAHYWIDRAGQGIAAVVTSRTYLDGLTHGGMRRSLLTSFDQLEIVDLHGDWGTQRGARRGETQRDENVFGVRQGVALGVFLKRRRRAAGSPIRRYTELRGPRSEKLARLRGGLRGGACWTDLQPRADDYRLTPQRRQHSAAYRRWPRLNEIFVDYVSGVQTKHDALLVACSRDELAARLQAHLAAADDDAPGPRPAPAYDPDCLQPYLTAPFDRRWIYYDAALVGRSRWPVLRHLLRPNRALVFMRQSTNAGEYDHFLVTSALVSDRVFYSAHGTPYVAPLWRYDGDQRTPNLAPDYLLELAQRAGITLGGRSASKALAAWSVRAFDYAYGVFFSPAYRQQYGDELAVDFPRVPWPRNADDFRRRAAYGRKLVRLHLAPTAAASRIGRPQLPATAVTIDRGYPRLVPLPSRAETAPRRLALNAVQQIPIAAGDLEFRWGGYPVLWRWLKQRQGRRLESSDFAEFAAIVATVRRTRRWMEQLATRDSI